VVIFGFVPFVNAVVPKDLIMFSSVKPDIAPPKVILPVEVTVPVSVKPETEPVPVTDVTPVTVLEGA
jgi:hypothetical protein